MVKVFITDAEAGRIPLNVVRSLGRKGIKVIVGGSMHFAPAYFSRYCSKKVIYPSIKDNFQAFKQFMLHFVQKEKPDFIFPILNESVDFFSKYKDKFSPYSHIPFAEYPTMEKALDKEKTLRLAESIGIPMPKTFYPEKESELEDISSQLTFPVMMKPKKSYGSFGVTICHSKEELVNNFKKLTATYGTPLVQEYIPSGGDAIGVSCLFNYGHEPRVVFIHRRLREFPPQGGPSTLRESIQDPAAKEIAVKLLKKLKWIGVAMVEFKYDPRDHLPKLMEINPRFWGSLSLPMFSGVDFPYLLYKMANDGDIEEVKDYPLGIKSRWVGGDFLYLLKAKNRLKFLPTFFKLGDKKTFCEDFVGDDILPSISRILSAFYVFDKKVRDKVFGRGLIRKYRDHC